MSIKIRILTNLYSPPQGEVSIGRRGLKSPFEGGCAGQVRLLGDVHIQAIAFHPKPLSDMIPINLSEGHCTIQSASARQHTRAWVGFSKDRRLCWLAFLSTFWAMQKVEASRLERYA